MMGETGRRDRIERFRQLLAHSKIDGAVVRRPTNVFYLTGSVASVGEPAPEQRRAHDALVRGLAEIERIARPGMRGCDLFEALLRPICEAGYGDGFKFHGGHALGLEHVERPYIIPGEEMLLEKGMVIALEPGVYLSEIGGLRVEDNYLVTATGFERLSHFPRDLMVCPKIG